MVNKIMSTIQDNTELDTEGKNTLCDLISLAYNQEIKRIKGVKENKSLVDYNKMSEDHDE